jgi:CubicO group peptidase (beta-lactamase class C family)
MKKLKIFGIVLLSLTITLSVAGYAFYQFYLKPRMKITPASNSLIEKDYYDKAMVDTIFKYTHANVRNSADIAIAIIDNGQTHYYGLGRNDDKLSPLDNKNHLYQIGSISKVFTSNILASMIVGSEIDEQKTIDEHIGFNLKSDLKLKWIDLSNHTSGLDRMPSDVYLKMAKDFENPYKGYDDKWMLDYLKSKVEIDAKLKGTSSYSNLGAAILGNSLAYYKKQSYEELLNQRVLNKYGMKNTFLYTAMDSNKLITSLDMMNEKTVNWELESFNPAGGIVSTIEDMAMYAKANLDTTNKELMLMQQPSFKIDSTQSVGLGWFILKAKKTGHTCLFHNGATSNFNSSMVIDLVSRKAIIVLSNCDYSDTKGSLDKLCYRLMDYLTK